jgi:hypothetical protein
MVFGVTRETKNGIDKSCRQKFVRAAPAISMCPWQVWTVCAASMYLGITARTGRKSNGKQMKN